MVDLADLERIYQDIEDNFEAHLTKVQNFLKTPCFSPEEYGATECVFYVRTALEQLGCNPVEVMDVPRGNPVIFAEYNAGVDRTLLAYAKYDNVGVNVKDWTYDPFEAPIAEMSPYGKCIFARGACGGHAPPQAFLNALESIKNTVGELPVNLLFIFEGDEEMGSINLPAFVQKYQDRLKKAEALISPGATAQDEEGNVSLQLSGPGITYIELVCSGEQWGKGPVKFGIHSGSSTIVESPLWRMVKALGTIISEDSNDVLIEQFYEDLKEPTIEEDQNLEELATTFNIQNEMEVRGGIKQFAEGESDPKAILKRFLFRPGVYIEGLTTKPGVIPHRVVANLTMRLRPEQNTHKVIDRVRQHLDVNGFSDISVKYLGGYGWWKTSPNERLVKAVIKGYARFGVKTELWLTANAGEPFSNFSGPPLNLPCVGNIALAHGSGGHAPDEYMVVEGKPPYLGLRELEKSYAAILYEYSCL